MEVDSLKPIPLVKLNVENITYEPITTSYAGTNKRQRSKKHGFLCSSNCARNEVNHKKNCEKDTIISPIVERKTILKNVTPPPIEPYELQAWMGPSGSGTIFNPFSVIYF